MFRSFRASRQSISGDLFDRENREADLVLVRVLKTNRSTSREAGQPFTTMDETSAKEISADALRS
jgi:hypothetical protein